MKKLLSFLMVFGILFGVTMVMADTGNQVVSVDGETSIDITLGELNFGTIVQDTLESATAELVLSELNNANLDLSVCLDAAADVLFDNMELDFSAELGGTGSETLPRCAVGSILALVTDIDADMEATPQTFGMSATLDVPLGTHPGSRTAAIVYTISGPQL